MSRTIMYLEDDKFAREGFAAYFRMKGYEVQIFETAAEAEEALVNFKPNVIISDQKLGKDDYGWEFLKRSIPLSPYSIRFILSGYAESDLMVHSFTDGVVFDYIFKGAPPDEVEKTIENAFVFLDMLKKKNLLDPKLMDGPEGQLYHIVLRELKMYRDLMTSKKEEIQRLTDLAEKNTK